MKKLRIGFVGAGYMGQLAHLENYVKLPDVEVVALAEGRPKLAELVAARFGIPRVYRYHQELCEDETVEAVVAIAFFGLNYGIARDLLAAGKHVATEKAMCLTEEGAEELCRLAEERSLVYQVCYMKRFDPGVRWAVERIRDMEASGEYGPLQYVRIWCCHGDWTFQGPPPWTTDEPQPSYPLAMETRPAWMSEEDFQQLISWLNYYSHQTNLLRLVLGEDYTLRHAQESSAGHFLMVETPRGIPAFMEFPRYVVQQWDEGFQAFFERAILRCDLPSPMARQRSARVSLYENRPGGGTFQPDIPPHWAMAEQAKAFVAAVRGGPQLSPPREAAKEIAFANELIRWRQGRDNGA